MTTLADVYSLGVVCYELFTGHRPYQLASAALHEMARVTIVGAVVMLILSAVRRRFGWKAQWLSVVLLALLQAGRDRFWFTKVLPVMTFETGIVPFLSAAAIYTAGFSVGLLVACRRGMFIMFIVTSARPQMQPSRARKEAVFSLLKISRRQATSITVLKTNKFM